jgi:hypothetical protein
VNFSTVDIDGDGKLDLVLTRRTSDATIGATVWKVFKGSGTAFAPSSTDFALPPVGVAAGLAPFDLLSNYNSAITSGNGDLVNFSTVDIDGDGKLDLVLTRRTSDATIGATVWKVFKGQCP